MAQVSHPDFTQSLQKLMQRLGVSSYKALAKTAGVSDRQLLRLRRGELNRMRVDVLLKLSQALQVSVTELVVTFSPATEQPTRQEESKPAVAQLKKEYERLQAQLDSQRRSFGLNFSSRVYKL
jgi:transcriptional regulator with XRE-family HTH domain